MSNFLTKEGYKKLVIELKTLKEEKLPEILSRLKDAIGQGDISENAEYDAAIQEKDLIETRIIELEKLLNNVKIIEEGQGNSEIKYGSIVQFQDDKNKIYEYTLVGTGEVDILNGTISFESPLGIAIKGKKKGDTVNIRSPKGKYSITILDVK